jgi:hypothetical protein
MVMTVFSVRSRLSAAAVVLVTCQSTGLAMMAAPVVAVSIPACLAAWVVRERLGLHNKAMMEVWRRCHLRTVVAVAVVRVIWEAMVMTLG